MRAMCLAWLALPACMVEDEETIVVLNELDAWEPAAVEVISTMGIGTVSVPVRLVNTYHAAVPGTVVSVTVAGTTAAAIDGTVDLDGMGYAMIEVEAARPEPFEVTVTASADGAQSGASATSWVLGAEMPDFRVGRRAPLSGLPADPAFAVLGTGGLAVGAGEEIWWVPTAPGRPAWLTADLGAEIGGMWSGHVDGDGILDLVAWSGPMAVVLRGHPAGGFAWGGAWTTDKGDVVGMAIADVDSDRNTDLVVGVSGATVGYAQILWGDGVWGFDAGLPLQVPFELYSIAAGDDGRDQRPDVDLLNAFSGTLRRYSLGDDGWAGGSPPELTGEQAEPGAYLMPLADLDANGSDEIVMVGAPGGSSQDLVFYIVAEQVRYPKAYGLFHPALADMNGDGATDILAAESDVVHLIRYDALEGFIEQQIADVGGGPIAGFDHDGDDTTDLAVVTDGVDYYPGAVEGSSWALASADWRAFPEDVVGDYVAFDANDDGLSDVVAVTDESGNTTASLWIVSWDEKTGTLLSSKGGVNLGTGVTPLGLVQCGDDIWALESDGSDSELTHISVAASGSERSLVADDAASVTGTLLACGEMDGRTVGVVASTSGPWASFAWLGTSGIEQMDAGSAVASQAIAVQQTGSGASVVGCTESGCSVVTADLDGDGIDEVIRGGDDVTVEFASGTVELGVPGRVSSADADGDGNPDVLAVDGSTGRVFMAAGLAGGVANPVAWHTDREVHGPLYFFDLDADGTPEWLMVDVDGRIVHTGVSSFDGVEKGDTGG